MLGDATSRNALAPRADDALDEHAAAHLLRRAGFGQPRVDVERACERGLEATVSTLTTLDPPCAAVRELDAVLDTVAAGESDAVAAWWVARMLRSEQPLREKLALFWHGHFATSDAKVQDARLMATQLRTFLDLGAGPFHALLHAMTRDAAMLLWLDGELNRKDHPNENYAREVFELFTLGIGNYDEQDIREAARALTGFRRAGGRTEFVRAMHDDGTKTVLGHRGALAADDVVTLCAKHPATARRLATRLLQMFAHPSPPNAVIDAACAVYADAGLDPLALLRVVLRSEWFHSPAVVRARIASPVEFVVGHLRSIGARADASACVRTMRDMGQWLLRPPTVKGWDGEDAWLNAATFVARADCARRIALGDDAGLVRGTPKLAAEVPGDVPTIVEVIAMRVLGAPLPRAVGEAVVATVAAIGGDSKAAALGAILALPEASVV
ncbi:MAG: DUF1800 domain-containing protein [Planctomycetes bacterium]|nr:DUF1800 domain-containing protein [Planctomycetota bacterium]MCC7170160.1 DUF1800 domain-containing protein [Planctomycetota bacterium]